MHQNPNQWALGKPHVSFIWTSALPVLKLNLTSNQSTDVVLQATEATRVLQKELREADCDGDGLIDLQVHTAVQ